MAEAKKHKTRVGVVVSTKMAKTVVVLVSRRVKDPTFGKYVARRKKFLADDSKQLSRLGDTVMIEECRPLSRRKNWKVIELITRAEAAPEVKG